MAGNNNLISIDDEQVMTALKTLLARGENMSPIFAQIGEVMVDATKTRFQTQTAPDGSRWEKNSDQTVLNHVNSHSKTRKKNGTLNAKGRAIVAGKKPLTDTGILGDTIRYQSSGDGVIIGTNRFSNKIEGGAAVHQFGTDSAGRGGAVKIPARPFLGFSDADKKAVMEIVTRYLAKH